MGFMDKAKKMAEQAQAKLDEAQKQFNSSPAQPPSGPVTEYDKHGRPIQSTTPTPTPDAGAPPMTTPGVPQTEAPAAPAPAPTGPTPDPSAPAPAAAGPEDPNRPSTEAPKMSHGDPLAG
jgi:hypothetical protein